MLFNYSGGNLIKKKLIHIKCFFHFVNALHLKLNKLHLINNNNKKEIRTILNNIEIICFINSENIKKYKQFIIDNLYKYKNYNKFILYLKKFWFIKPDNEYNYSNIINKYYNKKGLMEKMYQRIIL